MTPWERPGWPCGNAPWAARSAGPRSRRRRNAERVTVGPPDATIGYLPQEPERRPDETVRQFLARRTGIGRGGRRRDAGRRGRAGGRDARRGRGLPPAKALARARRRPGRAAGAVATGLGLTAEYLAERDVARRHVRADYESTRHPRGLQARTRGQRAWMEKGVKNARRNTESEPISPLAAYGLAPPCRSMPNICGLDAAGSWDWPCPDRPVRCAGRGARAGRARWSCSTPGGRLEPARSPPGTFGWAWGSPASKAGGAKPTGCPGDRGTVAAGTFGRRRSLPSVRAGRRGLGILHRPGAGCLWPFFGIALVMPGPAGRARKGVESRPC